MTGRRIFSRIGPPIKNMSFHISCIANRTSTRRGYHVTLPCNSVAHAIPRSCNFGVPAMPVGVLLKDTRGLDNRDIVASASHELQSHRKILVGETAGNGECRKPAQISDATLRIRVRESRLQIQVQRSCRDWLRGRYQYIERVEHRVHFLLQDVPNALRLHVIGAGKLFVYIPGKLPKRISQFADAPRTNEGTKRGSAFHRNDDVASVFKR